jgi:hypothetical protein
MKKQHDLGQQDVSSEQGSKSLTTISIRQHLFRLISWVVKPSLFIFLAVALLLPALTPSVANAIYGDTNAQSEIEVALKPDVTSGELGERLLFDADIEPFGNGVSLSWIYSGPLAIEEVRLKDVMNNNERVQSYDVTMSEISIESLKPGFHLFQFLLMGVNEAIADEYFIAFDTSLETASDIDLNTLVLIMSKEKVKISWGNYDGVETYTVYSDGEMIGLTSESEYTLNMPSSDDYLSLEVRFEVPLSDEELEEIKVIAANYNISAEDLGSLTKSRSMMKLINRSYLDGDQQPVAITEKAFNWTYKTFIPDQYAVNPFSWVDDIKFFGGDNRDFDPSSLKYRTYFYGSNIYYNDNTASKSFGTKVGVSKGYDEAKNLIRTATAGIGNSGINYLIDNSDYKLFQVNHAVENPLVISPVVSPDIDYTFLMETQKNGSWVVNGSHDKAPNHEMYLKTKTDHQHVIQTFLHLLPGMDQCTWHASGAI